MKLKDCKPQENSKINNTQVIVLAPFLLGNLIKLLEYHIFFLRNYNNNV